MRYLKHSTVDFIHDHDWSRPLHLYGGYSDEFESLLNYIDREARTHKMRLSIRFPRGFNSEVIISKAG